MQECVLYKKIENNEVQCIACNHKCIINEGKRGICGVRENNEGRLYLLVYGLIISENIDPIEKKPLYHFLPNTKTYSIGTVGCNLKCYFCQNHNISQMREIVGRDISPEEIVERAIKTGCKSISYTYNEPTIFAEFVKDTAVLAKQKGLKNILVTNGYMTKECLDFLGKDIDAMNIDLKSFDEKFYKNICAAKIKPVLETIRLAHEMGIHIEITTLVVPGENNSPNQFEKIAKFIASVDENIPWHITRFFPMYKMKDKLPTPLEILEKAEKIGKKYLKYVHLGNV
ncbi:MAG: AmmeMemoRadiSam system radical SAM enzyme [Nanobdellota archaeon]